MVKVNKGNKGQTQGKEAKAQVAGTGAEEKAVESASNGKTEQANGGTNGKGILAKYTQAQIDAIMAKGRKDHKSLPHDEWIVYAQEAKRLNEPIHKALEAEWEKQGFTRCKEDRAKADKMGEEKGIKFATVDWWFKVWCDDKFGKTVKASQQANGVKKGLGPTGDQMEIVIGGYRISGFNLTVTPINGAKVEAKPVEAKAEQEEAEQAEAGQEAEGEVSGPNPDEPTGDWSEDKEEKKSEEKAEKKQPEKVTAAEIKNGTKKGGNPSKTAKK